MYSLLYNDQKYLGMHVSFLMWYSFESCKLCASRARQNNLDKVLVDKF